MHTKIQQWDNSQELRIPKAILDAGQFSAGDEVMVSAQEGKIIVTSVDPNMNQMTLRSLVNNIPEDYTPEEVAWGMPVGKEEW